MHPHSPNLDFERRVAIIGAGPAGIVTARWLIAKGLTPVIYEASDKLGGHWNCDGAQSATWPGMRANTSRDMTAFSDLDHAEGTPVYPRQEQMAAYLESYAERFGLGAHLRLSTRVQELSQDGDNWRIRAERAGLVTAETYRRVIIASGRHIAPSMPTIHGLESFSGVYGVKHTAKYTGADHFSGKSVLVAGCSISALEIATDLAMGGAASVDIAMRKQRYVLPKLIAGVPTDHVLFNRAAALAAEVLPPDALAVGLKEAVLRAAGNPAQIGAAAPDENIFSAGISQSQGFLPAVAEGRIRTHPWIKSIDGRKVTFNDESSTEVDAILFGTGFRPAMPFLAPEIAVAIGLDGPELTLHAQTSHPDLNGLAFVGIFDLVGPYFPVLELQARWVAQIFAGHLALPGRAEQFASIASARHAPRQLPMHALAVQFARLAGVEPDPSHWPELERALLFGPLSPASFRLEGPDAAADSPERTLNAARAFGRMMTTDLDPEERSLRDLVLGVRAAAA